jgi:hypothetical protein
MLQNPKACSNWDEPRLIALVATVFKLKEKPGEGQRHEAHATGEQYGGWASTASLLKQMAAAVPTCVSACGSPGDCLPCK